MSESQDQTASGAADGRGAAAAPDGAEVAAPGAPGAAAAPAVDVPPVDGRPADARARPAPSAWLLPRHACPPPPRPGERHVRLPRVGVILSDDELRRRVDGWFHKPMIVLAVLVLPLLGLEFLLLGRHPQLQQGILGVLIPLALAVIWLAFFVEFVIKITIAESRVEYVRRHWIDLAIIVMPLLRPLRIARVARASKIFTLRGVGMKMARYGVALFLGVEAGERLAERFGLRRAGLRDPSEMTRHQLELEVRRLRRKVESWERWHAEHREHRDRFGRDEHFEARPTPEPVLDRARAETAEAAEADAAAVVADPEREAGGDAPARSAAPPLPPGTRAVVAPDPGGRP